jgi:hypothetical protein
MSISIFPVTATFAAEIGNVVESEAANVLAAETNGMAAPQDASSTLMSDTAK